MKIFISLLLFSASASLLAQNGYVKLYKNDSLAKGYIRYYYPVSGARSLEIWRDKNDKHPLRLGMEVINEYAINKDTFKIFRNYTPFPESKVYIEFSRANIISRAKITLYEIYGFKNPNVANPLTGYIRSVDENFFIRDKVFPIYGHRTYILYVIEDRSTGYTKALSANYKKMRQTLLEFIPEEYLVKYEKVKGKIKYKNIPKLIRLYNSK